MTMMTAAARRFVSRFFPRMSGRSPRTARRFLANWRLSTAAALGVLLASTIMAGTVIYFEALRELALRSELRKLSADETNIAIKTDRGPTAYDERDKVTTAVESEVDARIGWALRDAARGVKSATFFLSEIGAEESANTDNPRAFFAHLPDLYDRATIGRGGRSPSGAAIPNAYGAPTVEALVPLEDARRLGAEVGDSFSAVPYWADMTPFMRVIITGTFTRDDPEDEFWRLDDEILRAATGDSFQTLPFYIEEAAYYEVVGRSFAQMSSVFGWVLMVDAERLNAGNSTLAHLSIRAMRESLSAALFSYRQLTELETVLREYDRRLFFSRLPMFVILILISAVALYYVITVSALSVERRRGEIALMKSRGASSAQTLAGFAVEGALVAALAVAAAPPLAAALIGALGMTPAFSGLSGGARIDVGAPTSAYLMSAIGGALGFIALIAPAIQASRMGVAEFRQRAARPRTQPFYQRYYLDVPLIIIAILLLRQLSNQGSVVAVSVFGEATADRILLAVPAVILAASALALLRLFPLFARLCSAALSRVLPAGMALGLWQMARSPAHYARLSLLLILMAGLGIFAASFGGTMRRSFEERSLYAAGADVRVEGALTNTLGESVPIRQAYESLPGVSRAALAYRGFGSDLSQLFADSYTMFAVEGERIREIGWFRDDFSERDMGGMLSSLALDALPAGLPIPDGAVTIGVRAKADRPHPTVRLAARIRDANDRYFTYDLGALASGGWTAALAPLARTDGARTATPAAPLRLASLTVYETDSRNRLRAGALTIDEAFAVMPDGETRTMESFDALSDWSAVRAVPEARTDVLKPAEGGGSAVFVWTEGGAAVSRGIYYGPPSEPLPVIANSRFLRVNNHRVGETLQVSAQGRRLEVVIIGEMDYFPTLDTEKKSYLIADLDAVSAYANLEATGAEIRPNEVWLQTDGDPSARAELLAALNAGEPFQSRRVHDREAALAESRVDPLIDAGWRALLFMAFAAVLAMSGVGFIVHAWVSFKSREAQFALMRTMGFSTGQLTALAIIEQALTIGAGLALGTWMGGRLSAAMMPFLAHDERGARVLPPFVADVDWAALATTYAAMALLFSLIITGVIIMARRVSLRRVLRLGEG